jgi:hypothetical protein
MSIGQMLVEDAAEAEAMAKATRTIVSDWHDDSAIPEQQMGALTTSWQLHASQSEAAAAAIQGVVQPSTATTSLVTTMTPEILTSWVNPQSKAAAEDLSAIIFRPSLYDEVCSLLRGLRLNQTRRGTRSSMECLEEAFTSLRRPASELPNPSAVLIAAREAIDRALADIKERLPAQGKAKSVSDKVTMIGSQCGRAGYSMDQFEILGTTGSDLHRQLSALGKQQRVDASEISRLFDAALHFLKALAESIDVTRLR